jgi:hypothetical protein
LFSGVLFAQSTVNSVTPNTPAYIPLTTALPVAISVTPDGAVAHSRAAEVIITGSNIVSTAVVSFTGPTGATVTVTPSQVRAAQIAATLPAALLSTAGTALIAIQNGPGALSNQLPFTIGASVSLAAPALKDATVGADYSDSLSASGGTAPYTWSLFSGALPPGLALSSMGTISGNPTTAGPSAFAVQVEDGSGAVATASGGIAVKAAGLSITTTAFPPGVLNFEYPRQVLTASGGAAPYKFAVTSGSLPAGLTLTDNVISGTPTAAGTSSFTITATDGARTQGSTSSSIVIRGAGTDLLLLSGGVSFSLTTGANGLPGAQTVAVQSTDASQTLQYSTAVTSSPWLSVASDGATPGILTLSLTQAALLLPAGSSNATVTLTCTSTPCATKTQTLAVSLGCLLAAGTTQRAEYAVVVPYIFNRIAIAKPDDSERRQRPARHYVRYVRRALVLSRSRPFIRERRTRRAGGDHRRSFEAAAGQRCYAHLQDLGRDHNVRRQRFCTGGALRVGQGVSEPLTIGRSVQYAGGRGAGKSAGIIPGYGNGRAPPAGTRRLAQAPTGSR